MKTLRRIIWRNFIQAKARNIISAIAIVITSILFTTFFLTGSELLFVCKEKMKYVWTEDFFQAATAACIYIAIPVIVCIGYLMIYNSFQNSVVNDVRFIGTLTAIGATQTQICFMMFFQAGILAAISILPGCVLGIIISKIVLERIAQILLINIEINQVSDVLMILVSMGFTLVTLVISVLRPILKASRLSIIASTTYIEISEDALKNRSRAKRSSPVSLAWRNIRRSFWRIDAIVVFLALGMVLMNTTISILSGVSSNRYIDSSIDTDFVVGSCAYMNPGLECFFSNTLQVSDEIIQKLEKTEDILQSGSMYYAGSYIGQEDSDIILDNITVKTDNLPVVDPLLGEPIQSDQDGNYQVELYGGDDFVLSHLEVVEGEIDLAKLKEGKSIIIVLPNYETAKCDQICKEADYYKIGEKITLVTPTGEHEYDIAAKCNNKIKKYIMGWGASGGVTMCYLPTQEFKSITKQFARVRYFFDVKKDKLKDNNEFLASDTNEVHKDMTYISQETMVEEVKQNKIIYVSIGALISGIAGLIGFLNLINSIITTILQRKKEISILESIGMTQKQVRSMLVWEGFFYGMLSIIIGVSVSLFISLIYLKELFKYFIWFYEYQFIYYPLLVVSITILSIAVLFPVVVYQVVRPKNALSGLRDL